MYFGKKSKRYSEFFLQFWKKNLTEKSRQDLTFKNKEEDIFINEEQITDGENILQEFDGKEKIHMIQKALKRNTWKLKRNIP